MKLIKHERAKVITEIKFTASPVRIWLDRHHELVMQKGDRLDDIAKKVHKYWEHLTLKEVKRVVAYWFALGWRVHQKKLGTPWTPKEMRVHDDRQYLVR